MWGGFRSRVAIAALGVASFGGCVVYTDLIAAQFNSGVVDSTSDPTRLPFERKEAIVASLIREELMDAYFGQGEACRSGWKDGKLGETNNVCVALDRAAPLRAWPAKTGPEDNLDEDVFVEYVKCFAYEKDPSKCGVLDVVQDDAHKSPVLPPAPVEPLPSPAPPDATPTTTDAAKGKGDPRQQSVQQVAAAPVLKGDVCAITDRWVDKPENVPICTAVGATPNLDVLEPFVDRVRFDLAVARAAEAVGNVLREGLVDVNAVSLGKQRAFHESARYLKKRKWKRRTERPTLGLVAKGGASTGIYTAGAVWTILNLIEGCTYEPESCGLPKRTSGHAEFPVDFRLLSGTSTGTMVVTAMDLFSAACMKLDPKDANYDKLCHARRLEAISDIGRWFTCLSLNDLYCVDSQPILNLSDEQLGVIKFDGIRDILNRCVDDEGLMIGNHTELILNITDFRSGRLLHLSDQGELNSKDDVVRAAIASAALPMFVHPETKMRIDVDGTQLQEGTFLDGGIRSEIPVLALAKRGAERAIIVSSSASVVEDTEPLRDGLSIALRYIDVSVGGVSETELRYAQRRVESIRLAEYDACRAALKKEGTDKLCKEDATQGGDFCDPEALCEGRWHEVCQQDVDRDDGALRGPDQRLSALWQVERLFRNAEEVEASSGYDFNPTELRRLFRAGAEAARQRCIQIATLLGVPARGTALTPELQRSLLAHCNKRLPAKKVLCGDNQLHETNAKIELRDCDDPNPLRCAKVCGAASCPDCPDAKDAQCTH